MVRGSSKKEVNAFHLTTLVEKPIEISIGFLHRKLAYGAPESFYGAP
jgi:hypothetical protein